MESNFEKLIKEICEEENINYQFLSKDLVIKLEKNGVTKFIFGYKFDLNSQATGLIADDKFALYDVLNSCGIPVAEHKIVYNTDNHFDYAKGCNTHEYVKDFFRNNNNQIVLKPNNGTCGQQVYYISNFDSIDDTLDSMFQSNFSISMCPFYHIKHEYRAIMLNGELQLLYAKYLPEVVGDGEKTIRQLLIDFNPTYFENKLNDENFDKVLEKGKILKYNWKFNLSQGSVAKKITDEALKQKLLTIAQNVCNAINLKFGSIDIIETEDHKLLVLEVNSGVMIDKFININPDEYTNVKNIYKKAIDCLLRQK